MHLMQSCKVRKESGNHFPIHCDKTHMLCDLGLSLFVLWWVFPKFVKEVLLAWLDKGVGKRKSVWRMALLCLF